MITTEDGDVAIGHPSILLPYPRLFCALPLKQPFTWVRWLWIDVTAQVTIFRILGKRSRAGAEEVIGRGFRDFQYRSLYRL